MKIPTFTAVLKKLLYYSDIKLEVNYVSVF